MNDEALDGGGPRLKAPEVTEILADPSLNASIKDCQYASVMVGAGENFLAPYAIFLKATNMQLGLLSSLPLFLGSVSQLIGVWLSELSPSRRRILMQCVLGQALVWLPSSVLYFVFGASSVTVWILIACYAAYQIMGNLMVPAWSSLIGDLAPDETRGRFFGLRNEKSAVVMLLTLLSAGGIMEGMTNLDHRAAGFFILFVCAFAARMISRKFVSLQRDPPYKVDDHARFSYVDFLKRSHKSNFAKFVLFISSMSFSVMISSPFFAPYMLNVLHFSYFTYTTMTVMFLMTTFLTTRYWGHLADKFGNRNVLRFAAIGVAITPILWCIWGSIGGCLMIQAFSGIVWGGYNLAAANFLFDAVTPPKRARCVAYQSITNCLFILIGSIAGAWMVNRFPDWVPFDRGIWTPQSAYLRLFMLSGILRLLACYILLPTFKEVRDVSSLKHHEMFIHFLSILPCIGTTLDYFMRRRVKDRFSGS